MKIAASVPSYVPLPTLGASPSTFCSRAKAQCTQIAQRLLSCTGWREDSPLVPDSTALVGQLRHVLKQAENARQREVWPCTDAERACERLQGWLAGDDRCNCTYADLGKNLKRIENAYCRKERELRQSWRNSWLSGTEDYSGRADDPVDFRGEAAAVVVRAVMAARSEVLNVQRMTPPFR